MAEPPTPPRVLERGGVELARRLVDRIGEETFRKATDHKTLVDSPVAGRSDGNWLRSCPMVGINVRTLGSFWEVVKYSLTLPDHIRGIHLLPIWEPGVVGSLYGMASWQLNPEFFSTELVWMFPELNTVDRQLRVAMNLLHATGRVVGMDVIPHTDRYAEMVLANPAYFEWLRRDDDRIVDHRADLHEEAERAIATWLTERGGPPLSPADLFGKMPEAERLRQLFGDPGNYEGRRTRRVALVDLLYRRGLEPAPATMAPPYRGLEVDPRPEALTTDEAGRTWRDYRIVHPREMSRVFGPLTRYKLYERKDDNRRWEIDFDRPRPAVWHYLTGHYDRIQARYGFDFMRGDMSHVQMRPGGVPDIVGEYYDPLRAVKRYIGRRAPYFAYFAESFLTPDDYMAYGSEVAHLTASEAEVTLGNLQSMVPGSAEFGEALRRYTDIGRSGAVTPAFSVITGDKDDPRFDHFHHHGEVARYFTGLLLGLPLYFSLGFRLRDRHYHPWPNEYYTKLYVFRERPGSPKAVTGPYRWGGNTELWKAVAEVDRFAGGLLPHLGASAGALEMGDEGVGSWTRTDTYEPVAYLCVVNFGAGAVGRVHVSCHCVYTTAELLFSWPSAVYHARRIDGNTLSVGELGGGAVRCYRLRAQQSSGSVVL